MSIPTTSTASAASAALDFPRTSEGKRNYAWNAVHPDREKPSAATVPASEGGLSDFIDILNPLQHIPVLGNIYRAATGDTISATGHVLGGMLFGGPIGFLAGAASALFDILSGDPIASETAIAEASPRASVAPASSPPASPAPPSSSALSATQSGERAIKLTARRDAANVPLVNGSSGASSPNALSAESLHSRIGDGMMIGAGRGVSREGQARPDTDLATLQAALGAYAKADQSARAMPVSLSRVGA